jgi:hypothetical protein
MHAFSHFIKHSCMVSCSRMDKDKDASIREYKPGAIWKNYVAMIRVVALLVTGLQYADFFHLHVSVASICP